MSCKVTNKGRNGEILDADQMIRKFKKLVEKNGVIQDVRKHEYFLPKSLKRKEKSKRHQILVHKNKKY